MRVEIENKERSTNFLSKVTGLLFGIFITSIIFAFTVKLLEEKGLYLGLVLSIILAFFGFYYSKPKTMPRMIVWGLTGTIIACAILFIVTLLTVRNLLEGF